MAGTRRGRAPIDPICGLPLTEDTAQEIAHDVRGSHGAVLLARLRRHLAPPAGSAAAALSGHSRTRSAAPGRAAADGSALFPCLNISMCRWTADTKVTDEGKPRNSGMRQLPALEMSTNVTKFWRSYVYVGVLTYSLGASAVSSTRWPRRAPTGRPSSCSAASAWSASLGPFRLLGLRLVATRWSRTFFTSWAACTFVFIAVGAVLDGGVRSPISYFLILPMLFAGLAYSAGTVSFLGGFGVLVTLVVGVLTPDRSWSTTAFLALAMVIAGVITAAAALNRDRLLPS